MRRYADLSIRPLWRSAAGTLEHLISVPQGSELWYDDRKIPFLQQDALDDAKIKSTNAGAVTALVRDGFTAESSVAYIDTGDIRLLEHTGRQSVQLQSVEGDEAIPIEPVEPDEGEKDE
jgi:hypothetical protein